MEKKNIVIIGGGFAGTSALKRLYKMKKKLSDDFNVILIDKKDEFEFLPMLPDIIGERIDPGSLRVGLEQMCKKLECEFIKEEAEKIKPEEKAVYIGGEKINYEYLIIAAGAETNFFGNGFLKEACYKLDNVEDGLRIKKDITEKAENEGVLNVVVVGGGYTGIEIASNVRVLSGKTKKDLRITMVERSDDILTMVPEWMRKISRDELKRIGVAVRCGDSVKEYDGNTVFLGSGERIDNAFCIWAAGVRAPDFIEAMPGEKNRTRIKVKGDLTPRDRQYDSIFIAGDDAAFQYGGTDLRMAVMFAMGQGKIAAENIINSISGRPLRKYKAVDLGYLIPFATGKAPGAVMGVRVSGILGYLMHYFMCFYRSTLENKAKMLKYWISALFP